MKVLVDTDVILDLYLERPAFVDDAEVLWEAGENGRIELFVAAITPISLFYFARKSSGREEVRAAVQELLNSARVCPIGHETFQDALALPLPDYEDAVQLSSALEAQLDVVVTRNLTDYKNSSLPVYSPADFLAQLNATEQ